MIETGLGRKVIRSLTWVGSANVVSQVLSWAITIIIVRQLSPGDFGLMAMALVFWGFLTMIGDFGLFASIVQSKEISTDQLREVFGFIIILNVVFLTVTWIASPFIGMYFSEPRLIPLLRALAIVFLFIPFYIIPHSLLLREMNFKKISVIDVSCSLCGASISLLFALSGHGVWSLVYGTIAQFITRAVAFTAVAKRHHKPLFQIKKIKNMLSFSSYFTGGTILRYFFFKSDVIVAGKFIGPDALGLYSIANQLAFAPVEKVSYIIPQIAFPAFSKLQFDLQTYAANFLRGLKLLNITFIPCYIILIVLAEDIVILLLGYRWSEIVLPMRILCVVMPLRAFEVLFIPAMNGLGKSKTTMLTSGFSLIVMMTSFVIGRNWGYIGLCWAWVVGYPILYLFMIIICMRSLELDMRAIVETYRTPVVSSLGILIVGIISLKYNTYVYYPIIKITAFLTVAIILYFATMLYFDKQVYILLKNYCSSRKHCK